MMKPNVIDAMSREGDKEKDKQNGEANHQHVVKSVKKFTILLIVLETISIFCVI